MDGCTLFALVLDHSHVSQGTTTGQDMLADGLYEPDDWAVCLSKHFRGGRLVSAAMSCILYLVSCILSARGVSRVKKAWAPAWAAQYHKAERPLFLALHDVFDRVFRVMY